MYDSHKPIFIIGAARSGTKFLRDCLKSDSKVYAIPYDVNYIWRYDQPMDSDDRLSPDSLNEKKIAFIRKALLQQSRVKEGGILLEKTVSNSLRVPFVEAIFPDARYVHLIRDGHDVAASAMTEWSAPPHYSRLLQKLVRLPIASLPYLLWYIRNSLTSGQKKSRPSTKIWGPRYPGIFNDVENLTLAEVCANQWQKSVEIAQNDLQGIPADRVFEIRYEDLVKDKTAIADLANGLELDSTTIVQTWESTVRPSRNKPVLTEVSDMVKQQ